MTTMTDKQAKKVESLKKSNGGPWDNVSKPWSLSFDDCVMVEVSSNETGVRMTLGIEPDGHCHS